MTDRSATRRDAARPLDTVKSERIMPATACYGSDNRTILKLGSELALDKPLVHSTPSCRAPAVLPTIVPVEFSPVLPPQTSPSPPTSEAATEVSQHLSAFVASNLRPLTRLPVEPRGSERAATRPAERIRRAATPPIELTHWRMISEFEANPNPYQGADEGQRRTNRGQLQHSQEAHYCGTVLQADELWREFGAGAVPPFARVDEAEAVEEEEGEWKGCSQRALLRAFVVAVSLLGLCCVAVGVLLGALTVNGAARFTICLLMFGVGVVLITVACIAWRLTGMERSAAAAGFPWPFPRSTPALLHSAFAGQPPSTPYSRIRNTHRSPYFGGIGVPDLVWRPPPPSYEASVRGLRMQRLFDRENETRRLPRNEPTIIGSPPPTYRSSAPPSRPMLPAAQGTIASRPPSYRSQDSLDRLAAENSTENDTASEFYDEISFATTLAQSDRTSQCVQGRLSSITPTPTESSQLSIIDCSQSIPIGFRLPRPKVYKNAVSFRPDGSIVAREMPISDFVGPSYV